MKSRFYSFIIAIIFLFIGYKSISQANTSLSNLAATTAINHSLTAGANNSLSLGTSSIGWRNLYLTNGIYLNGNLFFSNPLKTSIAIGNKALYLNSSAGSLIAIGDSALYHNTSGARSTAVGSYSLFKNTTGDNNTTLGYQTLYNTTAGSSNVATGMQALYSNTTGSNNNASGAKALYSNTTGYSNVAVGIKALYSNRAAYQNIAIGDSALYNNGTGEQSIYDAKYNTAIGSKALYSNTIGYYNTANGEDALFNNTTGSFNTAIGIYALHNNTTGNFNTALGEDVLLSNTTGYDNTALGSYADVHDGLNDATALGFFAVATASNQIMLGDASVTTVMAAGNYTIYSDGRYKKDIQQNVPGLEFIKQLRPVTYHYDVHGMNDKMGITAQRNKRAIADAGSAVNAAADKAMEDGIHAKEKKLYTGFVAQEVEVAARKLNYDFSGVYTPQNDKDLYGLSYADFVVPIVKAVQELSKQNDSLKTLNNELENKYETQQHEINELKAMIISNSNQSTLISSASLAQNVPNPFSGSTSISYNLPHTYTSAKIIITDKKGVVLKQISLNTKGMGNINVDASTLASSAYQYSLYVNGRLIDTKQMVLAK